MERANPPARRKPKSGSRSMPPGRTAKPAGKTSAKSRGSRPLLADDYLSPQAPVSADNQFLALGVHPELAASLATEGIVEPFAIQSATLPDSIAGRDVLGRGQTGSGKTLAFGLGMLTSLAFRKTDAHQPVGLVLVPTRELAQQVDAVLKPLARRVRLSTQVIAGGLPYAKQLDALRRAVSILVATPGRLIDLVNRGDLDLSRVQVTVLDEADQMSDMGFMPDMITILDQVKPAGQRMLFSATLDGAVDTLVKRYLDNPIRHEVDTGRASVESMEHHVLVVEPKNKDIITAQIGARRGRTIMFARTQLGAERIGEALANAGVACGVLHGGMAQRVRTRTLAAFSRMPDAVLVATDVAARGIHVDGISLVVNVDAPTDHKDYLHRAGRTARAGEAGTVVTLTYPRQKQAVLGMLGRAGVRPAPTHVRPLDAALVRVTGAQEPSGEPWTPPPLTHQPRPRRGQAPRASHTRTGSPAKTRSAGKPAPSGKSRDGGKPSQWSKRPASDGPTGAGRSPSAGGRGAGPVDASGKPRTPAAGSQGTRGKPGSGAGKANRAGKPGYAGKANRAGKPGSGAGKATRSGKPGYAGKPSRRPTR